MVHLLCDLVNRIDVLKGTCRASCDRCLIYLDLSVMDLGVEIKMDVLVVLKDSLRLFLRECHIFLRICDDIRKRISIARMERKCDHRNDRVEIDLNDSIVHCRMARFHLLEIIRTFVDLEITLCLLISCPYGGKACGLCGHRIDSVTEIHGHAGNARSDELQDLILNKVIFKYFSDDA